MNKSETTLTRTVCGMKLDNGGRCQNPVKPGKGPCWRHADGFWRKVQSFARNDTKKFVLTTVISLVSLGVALYKMAQTSGPNNPAVIENGSVINYGTPTPRPWVAIKDPALTNTVELSDRGFDAWIRLRLENTSDTPAVAAVGASLYFVTDHQPKAGIDKAEDDLCQRIQYEMVSEKSMTSTVFRGTEQYPMTWAVHADKKETDEAVRLASLNFLPPRSEPIVIPLIVSCVVYRAATGKDYYNSAYANQVARTVRGARGQRITAFMFAKKMKYSVTELAFPPSFESAIRAK